jgi:hypothetical protein
VRQFFELHRTAPSSEALQGAINVIEARAHYDGERIDVGLRVAAQHGLYYLDLGDDQWQTVEIGPHGWQVIDSAPVRFRRAAGMLPLPMPTRNGDLERLERLRRFINVRDDRQFVLAVAWLLAALRPVGPYPVLALAGEQGSAKSTLSKLLRWLIDPNSAPLRSLPREDRDLFIAANNGHVLVFDNVSGLPAWISDTISRLATGGGFSTRTLYSDQEETLFDAQRPIILNGIEDIVERPDLADRSLFLTLEPIPKNKRRQDRELMEEFELARPAIMGALFDATVAGIQNLPDTYLHELPRITDFATWVSACEAALWKKGTFISAYTGNIAEATHTLIEGDIVATAIVDFMENRESWVGPAKELLEHLTRLVGDQMAKHRNWPKTPKGMAGQLRRLAPSLKLIGLVAKAMDRDMHSRPWLLEWRGEQPSFPSSPSGGAENRDISMTVNAESHDERHSQSSCSNSLEAGGNDIDDDHDGHLPLYSGNDPFASLRNPSLRLAKRGRP